MVLKVFSFLIKQSNVKGLADKLTKTIYIDVKLENSIYCAVWDCDGLLRGAGRADLMTSSKVHLSNVDISAVYLNILSITLHKINQNKIILH